MSLLIILCPMWSRPHVSRALCAVVPRVPCALLSLVLHVLLSLTCYVPYVPCALSASCFAYSRILHVLYPTWSRAVGALVSHMPCALRALCLTCLVPNVLSYLTCLTSSCTSRVLCLVCSGAARVPNSTWSCAPRPLLASGVSSLTCLVSLILLLL